MSNPPSKSAAVQTDSVDSKYVTNATQTPTSPPRLAPPPVPPETQSPIQDTRGYQPHPTMDATQPSSLPSRELVGTQGNLRPSFRTGVPTRSRESQVSPPRPSSASSWRSDADTMHLAPANTVCGCILGYNWGAKNHTNCPAYQREDEREVNSSEEFYEYYERDGESSEQGRN